MHLLEFFFFEYMTELRQTVFPSSQEIPKTFPLVSFYSNWLGKLSRNSVRQQKLKPQLKALFRRAEILWQPYPNLGYLLPDHLKTQLRSTFRATALIAFNELEYHRPDNFPKKFGLEEVDIIPISLPILPKPVSRRSQSTTDWVNKYKTFVDIWLGISQGEQRSQSYIIQGPVLDELVGQNMGGDEHGTGREEPTEEPGREDNEHDTDLEDEEYGHDDANFDPDLEDEHRNPPSPVHEPNPPSPVHEPNPPSPVHEPNPQVLRRSTRANKTPLFYDEYQVTSDLRRTRRKVSPG